MYMTRPLKKPLYDNIIALAPDGAALCRCNQKKAEWYLQRDLAEIVSDDPITIRLKFEPKGRGHAGDEFYLSQKFNVCVVCGTTEDHTRHHVVPYCFRQHFPEKTKRHNSHDICLLCTTCHDEYEVFADKLKTQLSATYGVPFIGRGFVLDRNLYQVKRHGSALKKYIERIPKDRIKVLEETLRNFFKKDEITREDIERAARVRPFVKSKDYVKFGKCIVESVKDLEEFVIMWRKHFLSCMKPQYMPEYWSIERKVTNG